MNLIKKGSADVTRYIVLVDSTAGTPETAYTIANLDLQYTRNRTAPAAKVDAVALAATDTAHTDNRAIEIDAVSSPGLYRVDWPDAAFATGVDKVLLCVSGVGLHPAYEEIQLVDFDPADAVALGLTALTAIQAKTDTLPASPAAVGSAMTLTTGERDAIAAAHLDLANGIETGLTVRGSHRLTAAAAAGVLAGAETGSTSVTIRNAVQDSKVRITTVRDADGNRTSVTTDIT